MARIIDGKQLAEKIKDNIAKEIANLKSEQPNLAIILIGDREDSKLYVKLKEEEAKKVGIDTHLYRCPENITEREVMEMIDCLNSDELIDAILVQLPLPKEFDTDAIILAIKPEKDVDGFHPDNLESLFKTCDHCKIMPPVFKVVLKILENINCEIKNKKVCIAANSEIFSKSLSHVLGCRQAEVSITHADDANFQSKTSQADILITAIGKPKFIKKEMVKKNAVIIDIGITKTKDKVCGDVNFEDVKEKAGYITPVPGGVGPMTIAMAFENTLELFKQNKKI
ncbi:bifunctional 5,10-methylenetetrahydrofolate dehydrogenase/5,10-methenyltetrahydrofolate cyclohydrolase [Patescibacteria group bacterium]|nr:bifunctional 5,10-methylenetetrahydrofolate dehydrogenase/5,10-methenyltetrahydrofolate cyclohydrolase [Candidatus Falkowbacteria bacterium]MBU3906072.1 bifunctional 5,10-methylenetetrahydrofolate dehydrogenase/5,10-methenyltetrahydrofolate cyclohydrolase [Patescibacteria group bacterium]MCG2698041.1 bifunctional 5,10-methylenetetrahydrofolate dehydrogenase/5,10-methenyltetrahydrofolate cyclohydrolase [Candidatus Parcubacteria bacterium]MBU4015150.1 bifunctional 5,10-methylenetetrahydrofolate